MSPETPKSNSSKSVSLTPSYTFGAIGPSPSFKFTSPRGLNLLSSLSPQKFFGRFCKGTETDSKSDYHGLASLLGCNKTPGKNIDLNTINFGSSESEAQNKLPRSALNTKPVVGNGPALESEVGKLETVDIWSFTNDSTELSMNLASINELTDDTTGILIDQSPFESDKSSSQIEKENINPKFHMFEEVAPKKRKLSLPCDSPCKRLASQITALDSPKILEKNSETTNTPNTRLWTSTLDSELMKCYTKYKCFKASHTSDADIFKNTSQNKVLSRMLEDQTGIVRSPKQVSGRLQKLCKTGVSSSQEVPIALDTTPKKSSIPDIDSSPIDHCKTQRSFMTLESLDISFKFKDKTQSPHFFTRLETSHETSPCFISPEEFRQSIDKLNEVFVADFDGLSDELRKQNIPIYAIECQINFDSELYSASPISPMSNMRQLSSENGDFSSFLHLRIPQKLSNEPFLSLTSSFTVYTESDKKLFSVTEDVNGYSTSLEDFEVSVPFLRRFWAGYLSLICNGTSDFDDISKLLILQTISSDTQGVKILHGCIFYKFIPVKTKNGIAKISSICLNNNGHGVEVHDDLETILVSSPMKSSPVKTFPIHYNSEPHCQEEKNSTPTFNSGLVQKNNVNYDFVKVLCNDFERPPVHFSRSASDFHAHRPPVTFENIRTMNSIPQSTPIRHQYAGHMVSYGAMRQHAPVGMVNNNIGSTVNPHPQGQFPVLDPKSAAAQVPMPMVPHDAQPTFNNNPASHMNVTMPVNVEMAPCQPPWQIITNYAPAPTINSAPATQVCFSPNIPPAPLRASKTPTREQVSTIRFEPILQYDPSKSARPGSKRSASQGNFHKFPSNPQGMFRPQNM